MERKTAHDFDQELLILFDAYVHGALDRRGFLDKAAKYAVGGVTAAMLLDQLSPKFLEAQVVKPEDSRIKVAVRRLRVAEGLRQDARLPRPARQGAGKLPAVLVIHENRGLNPHIEDIARRLALDNFVAFAPDALFPLGGYPGDEDKAREVFPEARSGKDARGLRGRGRLAQGAARNQRQARRGGLLLRRRHGQLPGDPRARPRSRRAVLRQRAEPRGRAEDQGGDADPVRRGGRAHQRELAGLRGRAEGRQRALRAPSRTPARSTASTTTRRRASTRRPPSSRGSARSRTSTSICGSLSNGSPELHFKMVAFPATIGKSSRLSLPRFCHGRGRHHFVAHSSPPIHRFPQPEVVLQISAHEEDRVAFDAGYRRRLKLRRSEEQK